MAEEINNNDDLDLGSPIVPETKKRKHLPFWFSAGLFSLIIIVIIVGLIFILFKGHSSPHSKKQLSLDNVSTSLDDRNSSAESSTKQKQLEKEIEQLKKNLKAQEEAKKKKEKPTKIDYVLLYVNLDANQTAAVIKELSIAEVSFDLKQKGKYYDLWVDRNKQEESKNILAVRGLPSGGIKGYELFDQSDNLGVTEFDKKIRFVRAISGELEKAIMQFDQIEYCQVQIVMPDQNLFSTKQPPTTASILVRKKTGLTKIKTETVIAIIKLVANSVEDLQPENINVVDTEGNVLSKNLFKQVTMDDTNVSYQNLAEATTSEPVISSTTSTAISTTNNVTVPTNVQSTPNITEPQPKESKTTISEPALPVAESKISTETKTPINQITPSTKISAETAPAETNIPEIQKNLANILELKLTNVLNTLLPINSYHISVNVVINKMNKNSLPDIKEISTNLVLNKNNPEINLTKTFKKELFTVIGKTINYQKNRDKMIISFDENFVPLITDEVTPSESDISSGMLSINKNKIQKQPLFLYQYYRFQDKYPFIGVLIIIVPLLLFTIMGAVIVLFWKKINRKIKKKKQTKTPITEIKSSDETLTESLSNEINQEKQEFDNKAQIIYQLLENNPEVLSKIIEDYITEYLENNSEEHNGNGNNGITKEPQKEEATINS